jgi:signal transduction histidine kinase
LDDQFFAAAVAFGHDSLPPSLLATTERDEAARQRVTVGDESALVVGIPLARSNATYFEIFPLRELAHTLSTLRWSLFAAACITTVLGAAVGAYASRRILRPLRGFAAGAARIAEGELDTRVMAPGDKDLAPIATSFNEMAETLQRRIEREARFAADVAHELRTPLTALSAAVEVVDRRVDGRAQPAVDVLNTQVRRFERLVLDLLEISRFDVRAADISADHLDPAPFVASVLRGLGRETIPLRIAPSTPSAFRLDKRRVERVLGNLLENADRHGGGPVAVELRGNLGRLQLVVDDAGPGVPNDERLAVFERFHRSRTAENDGDRGTGLGLAIVAEHVALHGGRVWIEDRPGGGARFVVELAEPAP